MGKSRPEVRLERRRRRREFKRREKAILIARAKQRRIERINNLVPFRQHPLKTRAKARGIAAPARINLSENFEETIAFLEAVREAATLISSRFFVDFTTIQELTAAGALLLVAEFDRWRELSDKQKLEPIDADKWNPGVRNRLLEMGFFDLLKSTKAVLRVDDGFPQDEERYLKFSSGHRSEGDKAQALRLEIEKLGPKLRDRASLFEGLTEAMTNVEHHAYPFEAKVKRWWMSASVDASGKRLRVMFLDHGLGIPRTLKPDLVEAARAAFVKRFPLDEFVRSDAKLIRAAVSLKRSQTGELNRGWGLKRDIQGYIERHKAVGSLRIISGRGQYRFNKQTGSKSKVFTKSLPAPFNGTFIEWIIEEYAESATDE